MTLQRTPRVLLGAYNAASAQHTAQLGRIFLWQRRQVLLHSNVAPLPLGPLELFNGCVVYGGVGAERRGACRPGGPLRSRFWSG